MLKLTLHTLRLKFELKLRILSQFKKYLRTKFNLINLLKEISDLKLLIYSRFTSVFELSLGKILILSY